MLYLGPDAQDIYPEEAFRSWEMHRKDYESQFGDIFASEIAAATEGIDNPIVLDAACGEGYAKQLLEGRLPHVRVVGVDFDKEALSSERWLPLDEEAPRFAGDISQLPLGDQSVDVAVSISGLNNIAHDTETFGPIKKELLRILKPSGKLVVTNDTPRGVERIMDDPLEELYCENSESEVVTYDKWGEISEIVVAETEVINKALMDLAAQLGLPPLSMSDYGYYMSDRYTETFLAPVYAEAARRALQANAGYRPFEWNSADGSWNKLFYEPIVDELRPEFAVRTVEDSRIAQIATQSLPDDNGNVLYAGRLVRDSVGNTYYSDLGHNAPDSTVLDVRAKFIVATKK